MAEHIQSEAVQAQGDRKVEKFLSFFQQQQQQELEVNEYLEDEESEFIQNKAISEIPNGPIKDKKLGFDKKAKLTEIYNCEICNKLFDNLETNGAPIKKKICILYKL